MQRSLVIGLALIVGCWSTAALSQADNFSGGSMPTLILPGEMTNPVTRGFDQPENSMGDANAWGYQPPGEGWEQPYSVEGEEQLEPGTN
jgi:hypothetical protein